MLELLYIRRMYQSKVVDMLNAVKSVSPSSEQRVHSFVLRRKGREATNCNETRDNRSGATREAVLPHTRH